MNRRPQKSRSSYDEFIPHHATRFKASSPDTRFFEAKRRRSPISLALSAFLAVILLCTAGNFIANRFVFVSRIDVPVTRLTESFSGYTLLHISDLKGTTFGSGQSRLRIALQDTAFDAVLLTGDMVSPMGNAQPLYDLIETVKSIRPGAPIYFIPGDSDPAPTALEYSAGGSPFAPWVLGAQQRGAVLLSAPQSVERDGQTLWLTTTSQLNLDLDTMRSQYEQSYLRALNSGNSDELELAEYNLGWLQSTQQARSIMDESDVFIALTHVPPQEDDLTSLYGGLINEIDLMLCGHYLGGLIRLPLLGPVFIPSQSLPLYGLFPGAGMHRGLHRVGRTYIYTSPGLGSSDAHYPQFFFRLFNPPTVTLISLSPSSL